MRKRHRANLDDPDFVLGGKPRELKHLSTWRKRDQYTGFFTVLAMFVGTVKNPGISLVAASETEEAQTVRITRSMMRVLSI